MIVLGIETSGYEGSIALLRDNDSLGEKRLNQPGRRHAQALVREIDELLKQNGLISSDVDLVAVSRGPGSFTGLRVGMVFAKTFAYAAQCRFIEIDTFEAIAENLPQTIRQVLIIEDAQRDDLFVGEYVRDQANGWNQVSPIRIVSRDEFLKDRMPSDTITGPGIKKLGDFNSAGNWLNEVDVSQPQAGVVAKLGQRYGTADSHQSYSGNTDLWKAIPFYLRQSAAEEKRAASASS